MEKLEYFIIAPTETVECMTIEKTFQGAYKISTVIDGRLFVKQYFFYTRTNAVKLFKQELKQLNYETRL